MKRITLLTAAFLLTTLISFANNPNRRNYKNYDGLTKRYRNAQPVTFMERGVRFFVFPNGEFDFDITRNKYGRRQQNNVALQTPSRRFVRTNRPYRRANLTFDRFGRISSVRNVPVVYDRSGRVFRIGSVFMNYGRRGLLNQVGNLDVRYSKHGRIIYRNGNIHGIYNNRTIVCRQ